MVILVDTYDNPIGRCPKLDAHREGSLHRAFSVFIFNGQGQLLMQRRAPHKYHSPGLWANTCCSHPMPGEDTASSARQRLAYEMGITADLRFQESFIYRAEVGGGLTEHEYDHLFTGISDQLPVPNPDEVMEYRYATPDAILADMDRQPEKYSVWFRIIWTNYYQYLNKWTK